MLAGYFFSFSSHKCRAVCTYRAVCSCSPHLIRCSLPYQALLPDIILHFKGRATNSSASKILCVAPGLHHRIHWLVPAALTYSSCSHDSTKFSRTARALSDRDSPGHSILTGVSPADKDSHQKLHPSCSTAPSALLVCAAGVGSHLLPLPRCPHGSCVASAAPWECSGGIS